MGVSNDKSGDNDKTSAYQTTSFSARSKKILIVIVETLVATVIGLPLYIVLIPYLWFSSYMVKTEPGESTLQWWAKYFIFQLIFCGFLSVASVIVLFPMFGWNFTGYHALFFFLPMTVITNHDRSKQYGFFGTIVVQNFFDVPLLLASYICREFFGLRLMAPFCNIINDDIVQGSLPFPSDIATLAAEPYNVGLIVNMCREYKGATYEMKKHGIVQCHLPHQDTTAVSYESLVTGCAFIKQFRKHNPKKRVFVHCKGGIGRASTMTLGHLVKNEGKDPDAAMEDMKAKRHVVHTGVKNYPGIVRLNEERLAKQRSKNQ